MDFCKTNKYLPKLSQFKLSAFSLIKHGSKILFATLILAVALPSSKIMAQGAMTIKGNKPKDSKPNTISLDDAFNDQKGRSNDSIEQDFDPIHHAAYDSKVWYLKAATTVNYFNLGSDLDRLFSKLNGSFNGNQLNPEILVYSTNFSIKADETISRPNTNFVPTGNLGVGLIFGRHQFEFDFGITGLVPLNTINSDTKMTLTESKVCTAANASECQLATLGMVNPNTGKGRYSFKIVMNEDVWVYTPSAYYDYIFGNYKWGRLSAGASAGLMLLSMRQEVRFAGKRLDVPKSAGDASDDYAERTMEGAALASTYNQFGPIVRIYASIRREMTKGVVSDIRLGFNYGFVDMTTDIDGNGVAKVGDQIAASFPMSSLGFKNREENRLEMLGFFLQASLIF